MFNVLYSVNCIKIFEKILILLKEPVGVLFLLSLSLSSSVITHHQSSWPIIIIIIRNLLPIPCSLQLTVASGTETEAKCRDCPYLGLLPSPQLILHCLLSSFSIMIKCIFQHWQAKANRQGIFIHNIFISKTSGCRLAPEAKWGYFHHREFPVLYARKWV